MRVGSLLAGVMAGAAVGLIATAKSGAQTGPEVRHDVATASNARQYLAQSLATIQSLYEATRQPGELRRHHLWQVGEALPWRSTLQPSCKRCGPDLKQTPQPWPAAADAPALRTLLADKAPGIRALAAEALATFHQPEDVMRLAALLDDDAEAVTELANPPVSQRADGHPIIAPGPDGVARYTWYHTNVAGHAAWGLDLILGECCPTAIHDLQYRGDTFGLVGAPRHLSAESTRSILAPLVAGDPKDHLWYWQEYIHRGLHQAEDAGGVAIRAGTSEFDKLDWRRQTKLIYDARDRAKKECMKSFFAEMRAWPAERRAMVRLLACNVHQGGADMAYYDQPEALLFTGSLELGLDKGRIRELLDGVRLWPDERRDKGGENQVVERLAMGWQECFNADDVPRLLSRFSRGGNLWWSARAALVVALSHLMPTTGTASDDPNTAEGFLRCTLIEDHDVAVRVRAASELMRMDLDAHWPSLMDRFFADRDNDDYLPGHILEWFVKEPAGDGPTRKLIELVNDDRYRPLWLEPERPAGKGIMGGTCRRLAGKALNARIGRTVVTDEDLTVLKDPERGPARLQVILARVRDLVKA